MKTFYLITFSVLLFACTPRASKSVVITQADDLHNTLADFQKRKTALYEKLNRDTNELVVYIKKTGQDSLVQAEYGKIPEDSLEYTYYILKEDSRPVVVCAMPYDESGDSFVAHIHYFDSEGKTFAYEKLANAFGDLPDDNVIRETTVKYFNNSFQTISNTYKLVDDHGKHLDPGYAFDRDGRENLVYPTADKCLNAYHVKLK